MNRTYPDYTKSIQELLGTTRKCIREIDLYAQQLNDFAKILIPLNDLKDRTSNLRAQLLLLKLDDLQKRNEILKAKQLTFLSDLKAAQSEEDDSRNTIFLNVAHTKLKAEALNFLQLFCFTEKEIRDLDDHKAQSLSNKFSSQLTWEQEQAQSHV